MVERLSEILYVISEAWSRVGKRGHHCLYRQFSDSCNFGVHCTPGIVWGQGFAVQKSNINGFDYAGPGISILHKRLKIVRRYIYLQRKNGYNRHVLLDNIKYTAMQDAGKNTFCHEFYFIFDIVFGSLYNRQYGRERFARGTTIVPYPTINKPMPSIGMHWFYDIYGAITNITNCTSTVGRLTFLIPCRDSNLDRKYSHGLCWLIQ